MSITDEMKKLIYANKKEIESGSIVFDIEQDEFKNLKLGGDNIYKDINDKGEIYIFGAFSCRVKITGQSGNTHITNYCGDFNLLCDKEMQTVINISFTCDIRKADH